MNDIILECPSCPLCESGKSRSLYCGDRFGPYGVRRCSTCGMAYLSPRPREDAMLALYRQDQYFSGNDEGGYDDYAAQELALRATFRRLLKTFAARVKTGGTLLEVGCGFGFLLDEARPYFSRRVGTDFSTRAVGIAQSRADQVHVGGIETIAESERFDCVVAVHVIEHVYHPHKFVETLLERIRPGGSLLIAAPDMGSFWRKFMGSRWPSFKLPEHVLYFDANTLEKVLRECGVQKVTRMPYPHAFPLPLIASKVGVRLPERLGRYNLWLPATTIAYTGVKGL
jgi:SAM-dependent methyltransferase